MTSLSYKSADELSKLLDEYGIKHGPVVESTRKLYEKKLMEAMAKNKKSVSDKTYYREEAEEVTYVTYHQPVMQESFGDVTRRSRNTGYAEEVENAYEPIVSHAQASYYSAPRSSKSAYTTKSGFQENPSSGKSKSAEGKTGGVPGWLRLLVFVLIAVVLYYVYSNIESTDENPFQKIEA